VAKLASGHLLHNRLDGVGRTTSRYVTRHDPRQRLRQRTCASLAKILIPASRVAAGSVVVTLLPLLDKIDFTVIFASPIAAIRRYRPPSNNTTIKSVQGSGFTNWGPRVNLF
jgi:hypothetical protein